MNEFYLISILIFAIAILYSSVGHGGASGYLAVLALFGVGINESKSTALILNIFVSAIAFYQYYKAGHFKWKLFYPFAILSIPMAYLGSQFNIEASMYKQILGACLIIAVLRLLGLFTKSNSQQIKELPLIWALIVGGTIGFISGLIGIGGGILLGPIILLFNWASLKETNASSALFIFVNSIAGIFGIIEKGINLNSQLYIWIVLGIAGGIIGAAWGSHKAENRILKNILASVLLLASLKLIFI